MAQLEDNQARLLTALSALEARVAALKSADPVRVENDALKSQVAQLESKCLGLKAAGQDAMKDLDLALGQIAALSEVTSHG